MKQLWIIVVLVAVLAAGCARLEQPESGDLTREIQIVSSLDASSSKAVVTWASPLTGIHFLKMDAASAPLSMDGASIYTGSRKADELGTITWTHTSKPIYDLNAKNAYLTACYPGPNSTEAPSQGVVGPSNIEWTIDGKTDILFAPMFNAGTYIDPVSTGMQLGHVLARLEVVFRANGPVSLEEIQESIGTITQIEIESATKATYVYAQAGVAFSEPGKLSLLNGDGYSEAFTPIEVPTKTNTTVSAAGMFAPSTGTVRLNIYTSKAGVATVDVQLQDKNAVNKDFEAGKIHRVTLGCKVDKKIELLSLEVVDWSEKWVINGVLGTYLKIPDRDVTMPANSTYTLFYDTDYKGEVTLLKKSGPGTLTTTKVAGQNRLEVVADIEGSYVATLTAGKFSADITASVFAIPWVEIDGVKWAKGNLVSASSTRSAAHTNDGKVGSPMDYGLYFQFGSLIGWNGGASGSGVGQGQPLLDKWTWPTDMGVSKPGFEWQSVDAANISTLSHFYFNYSLAPWQSNRQNIREFNESIAGQANTTGTLSSGRYATLGVGDPCTYYMDDHWRLPTMDEWAALTGVTGIAWIQWTAAGVKGRWVTASETFGGIKGPGAWFGPGLLAGKGTPDPTKNIFLPAAGFRAYFPPGKLGNVDALGSFWTSSVNSAEYGTICIISATNGLISQSLNFRANGNSIRCVYTGL